MEFLAPSQVERDLATFERIKAGEAFFQYETIHRRKDGTPIELSFNAKRWDTNRISSEFRPIIGWHLNPVDLIFNPIFDTSYKGGVKSLEFVPSARLASNLNPVWALAVEEYAGFGEVRRLQSGKNASHQLYGVIDRGGTVWDVEIGAGVGLTDAADKFTLKLIVARDLYSRKK